MPDMSDEEAEAMYRMDAPGMSVSATAGGGLASAANPYRVNFDQLKLKVEKQSKDGLDYVFPEQHAAGKHMDWSATVIFGTGVAYLGGSMVGGAWGLFEGLRRPDGKSMAIRINSVLNACGRRGPFVGNRLGSLAFMYTFIDGAVVKLRDGESDMMNRLGSGMATGALFSARSGPRSMVAMAAAGGVFAGVASVAMTIGGSVAESVYEPEYR